MLRPSATLQILQFLIVFNYGKNKFASIIFRVSRSKVTQEYYDEFYRIMLFDMRNINYLHHLFIFNLILFNLNLISECVWTDDKPYYRIST